MQKPPQDLVTEEILGDMSFEKIGCIMYTSDQDSFKIPMQKSSEVTKKLGVVYIWIIESPEPGGNITRQVGYVGFSAENVYHRRSQWQSSLNGGKKARKKAREENDVEPEGKGRGAAIAKMLKSVLASGATISVWYRHSERIKIFGEDVSRAKCEEDALIKKYNPRWNWSGDEDKGDVLQ